MVIIMKKMVGRRTIFVRESGAGAGAGAGGARLDDLVVALLVDGGEVSVVAVADDEQVDEGDGAQREREHHQHKHHLPSPTRAFRTQHELQLLPPRLAYIQDE